MIRDAASPFPTPPARSHPRNLVVCCDGTNNTLTGGVEDTNVLLLYCYLRKHADPAVRSRAAFRMISAASCRAPLK